VDREQYGVWRKLPGELPKDLISIDPAHELWCAFSWDGENSDASRVKAGLRLGKLLHFIATHDPSARIHVIAHSHGGNVLLKASSPPLPPHTPPPLSLYSPATFCTLWVRTVLSCALLPVLDFPGPCAGSGDIHE